MDRNHNIKLSKHELEEETEEQQRFKKIIKIVIGIVLIILVFSFVVPNDVLQSLASSKTLKQSNTIGDNKILFKPDILDNLQIYYKEHQIGEFKLCLTGFTRNESNYTGYYVTGFYEPKILFKTPISIQSEICNSSAIIDLHSHPFRNCLFSTQDMFSYDEQKNMLGAVMCDVDRFNFYN